MKLHLINEKFKCKQSRLYFGGCQIFTTKKFSFNMQAAKDVKAEIGVYCVKLPF